MKTAPTEQLVKRFEELGIARGAAKEPKSANRAFDEQRAILGALESREPPAIPLLESLLTSSDPWVRISAAAPLLFFLPTKAEGALERIMIEEFGFPRITARVTLEQWRAGKLERWW